MFRKLLRLHLGLILMSPPAAGLGAGTAVIDVGSRKQFFVDERFIESSRGVRLTMNPPWQDRRILLESDEL